MEPNVFDFLAWLWTLRVEIIAAVVLSVVGSWIACDKLGG